MAVTGLTAKELADKVEKTLTLEEGMGLECVREGFGRFLKGMDPFDTLKAPHVWSFLSPRAEMTWSMTVTGTGTGVYDDSTYTVITATTAIFSPEQVGDTITVDGSDTYEVKTYTSSTIVSISGDNAFAAKSLSLPHSGVYTLPANFGGLVAPFVYPYSALQRPLLEKSAPSDIMKMLSYQRTVGTPAYYAISADPLTAQDDGGWGTGSQRFSVMVFPRPEADRIVRYQYKTVIQADAVTDRTDSYLLGGIDHDRTITAGAMAHGEWLARQERGSLEEEFRREMAGSIQADKMLKTRLPLSR